MDTPAGHDDPEITRMLEQLRGEDRDGALARLLPVVYDRLRGLSEAHLRQERANHTLQATALVHEAYMRLMESNTIHYEDRAHFFRIAARIMRQILVSHARRQQAEKRGGGAIAVQLEEATVALPDRDVTLLDVDAVLDRLARADEQKARIVELRFFCGCTVPETAETLGISPSTVERDWRFARAWLYRELESLQGDPR